MSARILIFPALLWAASLCAQTLPEPLQYVNPFIGTDAHGHTYPGATAPFGFVQLSPDTRPNTMDWDGCSGYHYSDSIIYGFSHTHLSGTGVPDYCDILFMPFLGRAELEPYQYAEKFQKSTEQAEAGYYSVILNNEVRVELTATERVGVHRYVFPGSREVGHLLIDLRHRDEVLKSCMTVVNDHEIMGFRVSRGWAKEQHIYFVARFSKPFFNSKVLDMTRTPHVSQRSVASKAIVGLLDFYNDETPLIVTVGISAVSIDGARANLEAEAGPLAYDFDKIRMNAQDKWAAQLGKIEVEGGSDAQKTAFYTALYHTMIVPNIFNDVDGQYRGRDNQIHSTTGHNVYSVFSLWDTYRACNPLYTLLEPKRTNDFIQTFLRQYEQGGLLPVWELSANETDCMIGNHAIPVIYDAWQKGIRDYDANKALAAMQKSADSDRYGLPWYRSLGYVPSDKEPESVSKTLEYAYDDWCIAQMAKGLNQRTVHDRYIRRAQSYKNIFDPGTGFFRGKNNAAWHTPFDPYEVNFNYTEANAWQYRFAVPQDISGLMTLLGGRTAFANQLDSLFTAHPKITGRQQADITGLIGQYVHGNEPSHHMAYLYNYAGQPWKTQQRVRQILDEQYSDRPDGLSGNEDCGQMSAWLVWSAMGLYPAVPGSGQYAIGTPWFEKATIHLDNGKTFTISAAGASTRRFYVQNARLNGATWPNTWINHSTLLEGGELAFDMTSKPSTWGAAEANCPVSAITESPILPAPFVAKGQRVFSDTQMIELGSADKNAAIYYTLDGSMPTAKSERYTKPIKIENSTVLKCVSLAEGEYSPVVEAEFSKLKGNLKVVRYGAAYDNQYTGRGANGLVDLLRGGADFRSGGWQGFQGANLDITLDLGSVKPLSRITAGFLQDENSWIFYPSKVVFEVSDDGQNFRPIGEVANTVPTTQTGALQQDFTLKPENVSARYLRVTGVSLGVCPEGHKGAGLPCWLFADEILVE
ncbi:MAG: GH92 family glycosyl hydrolase [Saprospiraceae bacterium]|nr:GH92 family glycosyl hydrolase [Saprospiraceae bacterium]